MSIEEFEMWDLIVPYSEQWEEYRKFDIFEKILTEAKIEYFVIPNFIRGHAAVRMITNEHHIESIMQMTKNHFFLDKVIAYKTVSKGLCLT